MIKKLLIISIPIFIISTYLILSSTHTNPSKHTLSQEEVIKNFLTYIDEHKSPEAVSMMSSQIINSSDSKTWEHQFNAFNKLKLLSIEKLSNDLFKIVIDVDMKLELSSSPIPNFGYNQGQNTRWVKLVDEDGWKVSNISTGP